MNPTTITGLAFERIGSRHYLDLRGTGSLENLATALAEGEHRFGADVTAAAGALMQWHGSDCPWFVPHPEHLGGSAFEPSPLVRFDVEEG